MIGAPLLGRMLGPLLRRVNGAERAPRERPSPEDDGTRFPQLSWDLRTLIAVFPGGAPLRHLHLNLLLGLTGTGLDRPESLEGLDPGDACDLELCVEGEGRAAVSKGYRSIARELGYVPGATSLRLGERLSIEGSWPRYAVRCAVPEEGLEVEAELEAAPGLHWWVRLPLAYSHYTSFARCRLRWRWGGDAGELTGPALFDHGFGRNLLPARVPLEHFRYEVLRLPGEGLASALRTEGPGGAELLTLAHLRPAPEEGCPMEVLGREVLEWEEHPNHAGVPRRLPSRWRAELRGERGTLRYEARLATPPRPVLGDGFVCGFDFRAEGDALPGGPASGRGCAEQFGTL